MWIMHGAGFRCDTSGKVVFASCERQWRGHRKTKIPAPLTLDGSADSADHLLVVRLLEVKTTADPFDVKEHSWGSRKGFQ